ncbi:zinc metallopeptidase [Geobacter hydrogenophilus]|uniref:Membrane protein n=1 Tax=Geobacter hydrogenophilus TaxID=40983 RepID=A0A9W6FYL3_9BACT|nr:neutral zinc metallopeptidase [Geobacter hydrogenophilus]MBT0894598.1 zinc metallopeptidase [Geobacter hydrogenophilus]GLI37207.1 membrane protein [Geobacter hydrogenophilus]
MRWSDGRRSDNVEDRRGMTMGRKVVGGGIGTIILALVAMYFGIDPSVVLQQGGSPLTAPTETRQAGKPPANDELAQFVSVVLADTEDTWHELFRKNGKTYQEPKLVLFTGAVESACGYAQAAMGPFYCPMDQKVYIDLGFYRDLKDRFQAPGDFAQAYVIAHEVGHHVQSLLGISEKIHDLQQRSGKAEANQLSVRLELQADCLAGIWAHHANRTRQILEAGDVEEALQAATSIGDDRLQQQAQGYVVPESFTHGSSEQRVRWFRSGLESGSFGSCNTFGGGTL